MTDLRQAAQQALEALCSAVEPKNGKVYARGFEPIDCYAMHEQAITALRTALEQQAEPTCPSCKAKVLFECVACSSNNYPPKRPWVGLTEEEKKHLATAAGCTEDDDGHIVTEIFRLAEAKLKGKNL